MPLESAGGLSRGPARPRGRLGRDLHQSLAHGRAVDPESAAEVRTQLVEAINGLVEKERAVTTFYFYEGLT